jgi:hypothetical protein
LEKKVTVKFWISLGPRTEFLGAISKADPLLSSGSIAEKLNLYGFSCESKPKFLTTLVSNMSLSVCSRSFLSKIFQSTYIPLIPVFFNLNCLVMGCELVTTQGIGRVGGVVL